MCMWMGCGDAEALPQLTAFVEDAAPEDEAPVEPRTLAPAVPWQPVGTLEVDDFGEAGWVSVPFPAGQRHVSVRTLALDADPEATSRACHRVVEARLASGAVLLPAAGEERLASHQRSEPGPGGLVMVLSTTTAPLHEADTLELRIALEDCALAIPASRARFPAMPHTLRVDAAWEAEPATPETPATVAVRMLRAEDSGWGDTSEDPALAEAWAVAADRFADAGLELVLEDEVTVPATGAVRYGADMLAFASLDAEARTRLQTEPDDARFVPVVLVRCLEADDPASGTRSRPAGQTTRIPGSFADPRTPSLVVISAGDCNLGESAAPTLDPERYGLVLAHELAHYLGLFHADFDGDHLPAADDEQLMRSTIAVGVDPEEAWLSTAQAEVLRRHPDVVLGPPASE